MFSDDDLKRLKLWIENDPAEIELHANEILPALLARLEAAERVCLGVDQFASPRDIADLLLAWKEAAGR